MAGGWRQGEGCTNVVSIRLLILPPLFCWTSLEHDSRCSDMDAAVMHVLFGHWTTWIVAYKAYA